MGAERSSSTALVRHIEWYAQTRIFDPKFLRDLDELRAQKARVAAGESYEEVFGPVLGRDELEQMIDDLCREHRMARRYRLPKHWHWMGER